MTLWEYHIEIIRGMSSSDFHPMNHMSAMNRLGSEGWEIFHIDMPRGEVRLWCKKQKEPTHA